MADFDPPFGQDGDRRLPSNTERENGFLCGPADRTLFNGLFHRIEAEIGEVISHAGITPTDDRNTLLREAIEALILAATGGGTADDYILMNQARARLPFFPDVLTDDGKIAVTTPQSGKVRVPAGVTFQHRGIYRVTTVETDFTTDASKTYHLRWNPADGFALKDLASGTYNPTSAAENNVAFDSSYDDMLVARVVTNSSNIATITNLANSNVLTRQTLVQGTDGDKVGANLANWRYTSLLGWGRTPTTYALVPVYVQIASAGGPSETDFFFSNLSGASPAVGISRYGLDTRFTYDFAESAPWLLFNARA